ncbi:DUF1573 domain-containing protein [Deltaproteobacteria bacterium TL4]
MKPWFVVMLGLWAWLVQASPRLETEVRLDQVMVVSGTPLQGTLQVHNMGDEPLKILGVDTSCGCTTIQMETRMIAVGESALIRFEVDTLGKIGRIEKTITIYTNEPDSPRIIPQGCSFLKKLAIHGVFKAF